MPLRPRAPTDVKGARRGLVICLLPSRAGLRGSADVAVEGDCGLAGHLLSPLVVIDDMVEREFTTPEREVRTFSIAVSKKGAEGNDVARWIPCDDWNRLSRLVGKGDRVEVKGHFRERTYEKNGGTKTVCDFVVENLKIEHHKIRNRAE